MSYPAYNLLPAETTDGARYIFVSSGANDIFKVIDYSLVELKTDVIKTNRIFNFGFADFDLNTGETHDEVMSDNGDGRKVLYTVLNTIPLFFEKFPHDAIMVTGSDSREDYHMRCFPNCTKRCNDPEVCKNKDKRINVYRSYIDKHYDELVKEYNFFGGLDKIIEPYERRKKYKSVFVIKKNN